MADSKGTLALVASSIQVVSVVVGVVISVLSFNASSQKEAAARQQEATTRAIELAKPFSDLQRALYVETVKVAAIIATPEGHTPAEVAKAKLRFRELYVAELSMVEAPAIEASMVKFAGAVDPKLISLTVPQIAALNLSHSLGEAYRIQAGAPSSSSSARNARSE